MSDETLDAALPDATTLDAAPLKDDDPTTISVTDANIGSIASSGTLQSITLTAVPTGYRESNFMLQDSSVTPPRILWNQDLSTSAVSVSSVLLTNGNITFSDLTLASCPPGAGLDIVVA